MGQDLKNQISINRVDNPLSVYEYFYNRNSLKIQEIDYNNFKKDDIHNNLDELIKIFEKEEFLSARSIDNKFRIKHLNICQYICFLHYVIVDSDNYLLTVDQIFNSGSYDFRDFDLLKDQKIYFEIDDCKIHLNIDKSIFLFDYDLDSIFDESKGKENLIISMLYEIESKIIDLIKKDCEVSSIKIEESEKNLKWLIVYSLAELRADIEAIKEFDFEKNPIFYYLFIDKIIELFKCFYREVTNSDNDDITVEFVKYLLGEKNYKSSFRIYVENILDKKNQVYSLKERRLTLSRIFYLLYKIKWFRPHFIKPKNQIKKGTDFTEAMGKLFSEFKGFSESNIRNNHLLDLSDRKSSNEKIQLISTNKEAFKNCFRETNKMIEQFYSL